MEEVLIGLSCGIASAVMALYKGRSAGAWFLLGLLLGPLGLLVAALPTRKRRAHQEASRTSQCGNYRICLYCAQAIRTAAVKCRYCQSHVPPLGYEGFQVWGSRYALTDTL